MAKIDVISSSLVAHATNTTSSSRIELTPCDLQLLIQDPIQRGLLYHKPDPDQSQKFEFETLIHHLKISLALTLEFFPPLSGRLGTIKNDDDNTMCFFLDCNNAGVEFTHAIAHGLSISDILKPPYVPEIVPSFFPLNGLANYEGISNPLFAVQATELEDGYFICCTANHVAVDGTSFWHFINSWSEISRGCDSISKTPVFERWLPRNNNTAFKFIPFSSMKEIFLRLSNFSSSTPLLDRVFHFSGENLAKLKAKANSEAGTDNISSLQALSAHMWRAVIRNRADYDTARICYCILPIGARSRIPLPDGYFGNAVYPTVFATREVELLHNGLGWAALKLNELVAQQTSEAAIMSLEKCQEFDLNEVVNKTISRFFLIDSPRHNVYGNDFGWGKPVAVRRGMDVRSDGAMVVLQAPESAGGGIDVLASLDPQKLRAMEEDGEFMEAVTI